VASDAISATVARLFDAGGNAEMAVSFWARTRIGIDHDVVLWRASRLLQGAASVSAMERDVAAELLVAAARLHYPRGPFTDGLAYAQAALRHALEGSRNQGSAYFFSGWFRANLQQYPEARRELEAALAVATPNTPAQIADVTHGLANIDFLEGDYATAQRRYREMLDVARQDGNANTTAHALTGLGDVDVKLGDLAAAHDRFSEALRLAEGDPPFQVHLHRQLGPIELALDNASGGLAHLERALSIARSGGDADAEREIVEQIRDQRET
jgi:tetratricopeptide (TPR) repeat protein